MKELTKIAEFIRENNVRDFGYHTWREVEGGKGKIRILVLKGEKIARVEVSCPYCEEYSYQELEWKRPFSFKCGKCNKIIRVAKMKDQVKRDMKNKSSEEENAE